MRWLIICSFISVLASSCSSFNRDWRKTATLATSPNDLSGRWEGCWKSNENGHHGRLRCLVTHKDGQVYEARFHAKYLKILSFGYSVDLEAKTQTNGFTFSGSADLGIAGGAYHYQGHAEGTNFFSMYSSRYGHGTFRMHKQ